MAITAEEIKKTAYDATPLYAVVGVGDLAVEKLKELPERFQSLKLDLPTDTKALKERFQATAKDVQEKAKDVQEKVSERVSGMDVRAAAKTQADKAKVVYGDLAARGQQIVARKEEAKAGGKAAGDDQAKARRTTAKPKAETKAESKGASTGETRPEGKAQQAGTGA